MEARAAHFQQNAAAGVAQANAELGDLRSRVQMLQARRRLHLALMALDARNFGTAREHLIAAGSELGSVQHTPPGSDAATLSRLAEELRSAQLVATENLSEQRNRIFGLIRQLDTQFPADPPVAAPAEPVAEIGEPATSEGAPGAPVGPPPGLEAGGPNTRDAVPPGTVRTPAVPPAPSVPPGTQ